MLTNTSEVEFGIGGLKLSGTSSGSFYLANIAMPHRVDNKGNSTRVALLVDVLIEGHEKELEQSDLGRSILKALQEVQAANGTETYKEMGRALFKYHCPLLGDEYIKLRKKTQVETEWHGQGWTKPLWRPIPPFNDTLFNSVNSQTDQVERCGIFGQRYNRHSVEKYFGSGTAFTEQQDSPTRRRRRSLAIQA